MEGKNGREHCGKKAWAERDIKKSGIRFLKHVFLLFFYKYVKKREIEGKNGREHCGKKTWSERDIKKMKLGFHFGLF